MNKVKTYTPPLFKTEEVANWKSYFDQEGYVVLKNILPEDDRVKSFSYFVADWNTVTPKFDFHDKKTWTANNCPMMWNKGMVYWNGLGQSDFMWYLRTHPFIREIFERLHGTKHLVSCLQTRVQV